MFLEGGSAARGGKTRDGRGRAALFPVSAFEGRKEGKKERGGGLSERERERERGVFIPRPSRPEGDSERLTEHAYGKHSVPDSTINKDRQRRHR
ncbi:uncharacterized protein LOC134292308 isoform X3 [Anolis carolinensis]